MMMMHTQVLIYASAGGALALGPQFWRALLNLREL